MSFIRIGRAFRRTGNSGEIEKTHYIGHWVLRWLIQFLNELLDEVRIKCHNLTCNVVPIINRFFWRNYYSSRTYDRHRHFISVKKIEYWETNSLLPEVILRHNTNILLDDITFDDISNQLQIPIKTVMNDGQHLLYAVLGEETMSKTDCCHSGQTKCRQVNFIQ